MTQYNSHPAPRQNPALLNARILFYILIFVCLWDLRTTLYGTYLVPGMFYLCPACGTCAQGAPRLVVGKDRMREGTAAPFSPGRCSPTYRCVVYFTWYLVSGRLYHAWCFTHLLLSAFDGALPPKVPFLPCSTTSSSATTSIIFCRGSCISVRYFCIFQDYLYEYV